MQPRKTQRFLLLAACAVGGCAAPAATPAPPPSTVPAPTTANTAALTVADLMALPVMGHLGVPLGTVVEIEATVIAGRELGYKQVSSLYLLKVSHVNGRPLAEPEVMQFYGLRSLTASLARDAFELHELKTGKKAGTLDGDAIEELERGYVGKRVRVAVYEVGSFTGFPRNLPEDVPSWADVGFGFQSSLIVVADRN